MTAAQPSYSLEMKGPGRWFRMRDRDGALYGVLYTNDDTVLGLLGLPNSSEALLRSGMTALRQAFATGVDCTAEFDFLFGQYGPGDMGSGKLEDLQANPVAVR